MKSPRGLDKMHFLIQFRLINSFIFTSSCSQARCSLKEQQQIFFAHDPFNSSKQTREDVANVSELFNTTNQTREEVANMSEPFSTTNKTREEMAYVNEPFSTTNQSREE